MVKYTIYFAPKWGHRQCLKGRIIFVYFNIFFPTEMVCSKIILFINQLWTVIAGFLSVLILADLFLPMWKLFALKAEYSNLSLTKNRGEHKLDKCYNKNIGYAVPAHSISFQFFKILSYTKVFSYRSLRYSIIRTITVFCLLLPARLCIMAAWC